MEKLTETEIEILQVLCALNRHRRSTFPIFMLARLLDHKTPETFANSLKKLRRKLRLVALARTNTLPMFWVFSEDEWKKESPRFRHMGIRRSDYKFMREVLKHFPGMHDYGLVWMYERCCSYLRHRGISFSQTKNLEKWVKEKGVEGYNNW